MDDKQVIKRVLAGDKQAYAHIINTYKNPLYATILRMTKNPEMAQDFVQEAFIKVYEKLHVFDGQGNFKSWLYRVAINYCIDEFRKKSYQEKPSIIEENLLANSDTPEVILLKKERERQLEKLISALPTIERMVFLLRYRNECSYEEIGEILNIPLSDVRNKLHRSKKKMRNQVKEGSYFYDMSERR